jgi:acyl-CoA reductase-like NAD-dependent aldehyde dehydrogenase
MKHYQNFIDGEWVSAVSSDTYINNNPADTRVEVTEYAKGGREIGRAHV